MSRVGVFFGTGYEEIEGLTTVDLLRRAGVETVTVSVMDELTVTGSHGIPVVMDKMLDEVDFSELEMIVLPGGMPGTRNLEACEALMEQVDAFVAEGKAVCAICAAPSILGHRGHLQGKKAIAFPGFEEQLTGAEIVYEPAVRDGNIITGRGMGGSIDFALKIVAYMTDEVTAKALGEKIVYTK